MKALFDSFEHTTTVELLLLNAAYLALGAAFLDLLGMARRVRSWITLGGVAYLAGMSIAGIASANLALVGWIPDSLVIEAVAIIAIAATVYRRRVRPSAAAATPSLRGLLPSALSSIALFQVLHALPTALVKPLLFQEWDSWAIWSMKGRALAELGSATGQVFVSRAYQASQLDYPILQPTWSALASSSVGGWSVPAMRMQLVLLAFAGLWAIVGISRGSFVAIALAAAAVAISSQPWFLDMLLTGYADTSVALLAGVTLVTLAEYARVRDRNLLILAVVFGGATGLIKNEGELAVAAGLIAIGIQLTLCRSWGDLRALGFCALSTVGMWAPWRIFVSLHHLPSVIHPSDALRLSILRDRFDRFEPSARAVWAQIEPHSLTSPLGIFLAALIAAACARHWAEIVGAVCWLGLSVAGLIVVYWISSIPLAFYLATSVNRVTIIVLLGATLYSAVLAGRVLEDVAAWYRARTEPQTRASILRRTETDPAITS
jgi:hypothetical protein